LECAKAILEVTGSKSSLTFAPLPQDDPTRRCPDITKAKNLLGWEPQVSLMEGLRKSLDYFKNSLKLAVK
jgi:dTDP-glucose 4,6-dehydratase